MYNIEEKWFNDLEDRCRSVLGDALKGYPDYLWMDTLFEEYLEELNINGDCVIEVTIEFELQTGHDFGFPIFSYGSAKFRFLLTDMGDTPYVYGFFVRGNKEMEFTIDPLFIDTMNQTLWILELDKQGWYDV